MTDTVLLVGNPNSGKTTLYNWLTGSRHKTVNYPGSTVELSSGQLHQRYALELQITDTPGTYSLHPKSPEEAVTLKVLEASLAKEGSADKNSKLICVVDATQLDRQLVLVQQLIERGFRPIVALTMADLLGTSVNANTFAAELKKELGLEVIPIDGRLGGGVLELVQALGKATSSEVAPKQVRELSVESLLQRSKAISQQVFHSNNKTSAILETYENSDRLDRILLHPIWGLVIFFVTMSALFTSIFWLAQPMMDAVDSGFSSVAAWVSSQLPQNILTDFISDGFITGVGAFVVFVPQILILFLGLLLLEDSGYLARAATLIDKPLSKLGLNGRSFVPLLSAHACAIPALMAARTISSPRERWLTQLAVPLMTCSARLPVYGLLLSFLFVNSPAWKPGLALAGIYFVSLVISGCVVAAISRVLPKEGLSFFALELPLYRKPQLKVVLRSALSRTKGYLFRAGPVILILSLLIWAGTTFPNSGQPKEERLQGSYLAQAGQWMEPVLNPMGADWRVGVGIISSFAAREVFVSTLAVVFHVTDNEETMQDSLLAQMRTATRADGSPLFTVASSCALIVFFMIALQCLATFSVAHQETRSWKFAVGQLVAFNLLAYVLAVATYQIALLL